MILTYYITAGIACLWLGRMIWHRRVLLKPTPLDIPILVFLGSQLISTFFSIDMYTSLLGYYGRFHGGLVSSICYIILYYALVNTARKQDLKPLFVSSLIAATIVSIYAILEHFGHSFSCLLASSGQSFDASCWKQDVQSRVFATFGQPNWLAAYLITLLPLTAVSIVFARTTVQRVLLFAVTILLFTALLFTRSRSGILGFDLGLAVLLGLGAVILFSRATVPDWKKNISVAARNTLIAVGVVCLIIASVVDAPFTPQLPRFWQETTATQPVTPSDTDAVVNRLESGGSESGDIRKVVWQGAYRVWQRYPVFGSGVETFAYSYYLDRPIEHNYLSEWDFLYNKAHNEFLNILATTGLVGLAAYLLLLGSWSWFTVRTFIIKRSAVPMEVAVCAAALLAGVAALTVSNFFGFSTVMVTILLFLFMASTVVLSQDDEQFPQLQYASTGQYVGLTLLAMLAIALLVLITRYWNADKAYTQAKSFLQAGQFKAGVENLSTALSLAPSEPLYYDELSQAYSQYALQLAEAQAATAAAQAAETAITASDIALSLNPQQLNFHKSRARLFITLSAINPSYLTAAVTTLEAAREQAPTDPKLTYNIGLIAFAQGDSEKGFAALEETIRLKPNYLPAREQLAAQYEQAGQKQAALEQYQFIQANILPDNEAVAAKIASLSAELKL